MIQNKKMNLDLFKGFSKLNYKERLKTMKSADLLSEEDIHYLEKGGLQNIELGEKFVENVLGYFQIPLGVATNFKIDENECVIPMAVEETSIIAAASKTAKWVREQGEITTEVVGTEIIGQIQFAKIKDIKSFEKAVLQQKDYLIALANKEVAFSMVQRGGGVTNLTVRTIDRNDGYFMGIVLSLIHI